MILFFTVIHDDVCPYATFNVTRSHLGEDVSQHLHLRTFSETEDALKQQSIRYNHDNVSSSCLVLIS